MRCLRPACTAPAVADWWLLCARHTLALDAATEEPPRHLADQSHAAGWESSDWAERIAPSRWGQAVESDDWVAAQRSRSFAAAVSNRLVPCPHTAPADSAVPVVLVARAPDLAACPPCAETTVSRTTTDGHGCDRCGVVAVSPADRSALLVGRSLIVVAQLCASCAAAAMEGFHLSLDGL